MSGILKPFEDALLALLNVFFGFTHSYGFSIILLTLAVRIVLLPLTIKQTRAQIDLQKIQPKVKALQKKHKDDKEKLNKELMKLYSENKVNPFGGCLPLIVQLPIFWALFRMLLSNEALSKEGFLFIPKLGAAPGDIGLVVSGWPYLLLMVLLAVSTYIPSKMLTSDKQQSTTMLLMSAVMLFIAWNLPAGVLIYWFVTNLLTIVQQYIQLKIERRSDLSEVSDKG